MSREVPEFSNHEEKLVSSDSHKAQVAWGSWTILLYQSILLKVWPWKASVLNFADTACSVCLLLLINHSVLFVTSPETKRVSEEFSEEFSAVMLARIVNARVITALLAALLASMGLWCLLALLLSHLNARGARTGTAHGANPCSWERLGRGGQCLLNFGTGPETAMVSQALRLGSTAGLSTELAEEGSKELLEIEALQLEESLMELNTCQPAIDEREHGAVGEHEAAVLQEQRQIPADLQAQIWYTIKQLALKAPGLDGIGFDFLKALPFSAMADLKELFHQIEMTRPWPALAALLVTGSLSTPCFPDAVPEGERRELVKQGEHYPVGLFMIDYTAQHATAELVFILLQEKMGYKVQKMLDGFFGSDTFFALAGCRSPTNLSDRGCGVDGEMTTRAHVAVEGWTEGYLPVWEQLQQDYPSSAPRNLGNMGYQGESSSFVARSVQERAFNAEGISLDFYRDYNVSWTDSAKYFSRLQELNRSKLLPCEQTSLMNVELMKVYRDLTGDHEGVTPLGNGQVIGRCFDGYFWYAPVCRTQGSSKCIPFITGGAGWAFQETFQKATFLGMPLAWAVGSNWESYSTLPMELTTIFYWWKPDPTFLRLDAKALIFPPYDRLQWEKGIARSAATEISIDKYISQDLSTLAPDIEEFMKGFMVDIKDVDEIMLEKLESGKPYSDVACRWLHTNTERWRKWLPDKTKCFARYGLYNEKVAKFVESRTNPQDLTCQICPPGSFSEQMKDANGTTFICRECTAGTFQVSGASTECDPCPKGEYQDETGSNSCKRCGFGKYQDARGARNCTQCPAGTTTVGFGSLSLDDCACLATTINIVSQNSSRNQSPFECVACSEGLQCPFSSSLQSLQTGEATLGPQYVPHVLGGYFSDPEEPLMIYKCRPGKHCPGGKPGECSGGRVNKPCASCPQGQTWNGKQCKACTAWATVLWVTGLLISLAVLLKAYDFVDSKARAEPSPFQVGKIASSIAINVVQNIAVFGLMSVDWTNTVASTSRSLRFILLDLDQLSLSCLIGHGNLFRFVVSGLLLPGATLVLILRWAAMRFKYPKWWPQCLRAKVWKFFKTVNTIGTLLQVGFAMLSALSLQPLMCYRHPNGSLSLLKYPSTFCGDSEQIIMVVFGMALMAIFVCGFFVTCSWAIWKLPAWSGQSRHEMVQAFTFLSSKFRLDVWYFGLLLLMRDMGLSVIVVAATDRPELQVALGSITILLYQSILLRVWPWKASVLNVADTACSICLLLLISQSLHVSASDEDFAETFSAVIMVILATFLGLLGILCTSALVLSRSSCPSTGLKLLHLGDRIQAARISTALKDCAKGLLEIEVSHLDKTLEDMNTYDLEALAATITLVSMEVLADTQYNFNDRVALQAVSRRTRLTRVSQVTAAKRSMRLSVKDQPMDPHQEAEEHREEHLEEDAGQRTEAASKTRVRL
ncbi:unnamed protein product [Durusdinium trenchii]|uniref:Tyrosine-protein kinase ephrin type A/B receptor-like domain-containing protein n=1 Tax=Durusdinium trenchii TaxID=1381693 RepID=A0ABP0IYN5_9DINO